jgi:hypothetical protein
MIVSWVPDANLPSDTTPAPMVVTPADVIVTSPVIVLQIGSAAD